MSVNGEYLRVTSAELERALKDPAWALELAEETQDAQGEREVAPAVFTPLTEFFQGAASAGHAVLIWLD
ncbi:DUF1877 family protein [Streptomyces sp. NPDC054949]